jgi:hypothetical protein
MNPSNDQRLGQWNARVETGRWICRSLLPVCLILLFSPVLGAQDFPRWQIFGGVMNYNVGTVPGRTLVTAGHGPEAGLAYSFNRHFRLAGEFDAGFGKRIIDLRVVTPAYGHYNSKLLNGLVGPEFVFRNPNRKLNMFAHYLTGIAYARDNEILLAGTDTGFAIAPAATSFSWINGLGGGMDVKIPHQVSFRVVQLDWFRTNFPGNNPHNNWRIATGFVLRLGEGKEK